MHKLGFWLIWNLGLKLKFGFCIKFNYMFFSIDELKPGNMDFRIPNYSLSDLSGLAAIAMTESLEPWSANVKNLCLVKTPTS